MTQKILNIQYENKLFKFKFLNHPKVVTDFISILNQEIANGTNNIALDFAQVSKQYFPSVIVPIVGIIDSLEKEGIRVEIQNWAHLGNRNIFKPILFSSKEDNPLLNIVWRFNDSNIYSLNDSIFEELEKLDVFPKGVLPLASWSLNEVMDNVLNHSGASEGFVMAQLHRKTKHIAFCVYDTGIGIMNSFRNGGLYSPHSQVEAIMLSIQEGVTSNRNKGQGNGLFGLHSLSKQGDGRLIITSGDSSYFYIGNSPKTYSKLSSYKNTNEHTGIDFLIDYSKEMDVEEVLTFRSLKYKPTNLRLENMEDERGNILIKVKEIVEGTGTRSAALKLKNRIMNILNENPQNIILDFENVNVISSSYADELIAKLLIELGLFQFNQLIRLRNLNSDMQTILQRSVIQRIIDSFT